MRQFGGGSGYTRFYPDKKRYAVRLFWANCMDSHAWVMGSITILSFSAGPLCGPEAQLRLDRG